MSILITGGTGFLGRHLVRHLVEAGIENLVVMDAVPNRAAIADVLDRVKLVPGDVRELSSLMDTLAKYRVQGIIHLAYFLGTGGTRKPLPSINVNRALTSAHAHAGQMEHARAALSDVRRVDPEFSLERLRAMVGPVWKRPEDLERCIEGLRLAGANDTA